MSDIDKIKIGGTDYTISVAPEGTLNNSSGNFTSGDGTTTSETYDNVPAITASQNHKTIFSYATRMIKNIRVLLNKFNSLSSTVNTINTRKATSSTLGQVTIGTGISVSSGKISVDTTNATFKAAILNMIYPVGSIYLTVGDTNPGSTLGGSWTKVSSGYVLATAGSSRYGSNPNTTNSGKTEITITTDNMPSHGHTITITDPKHTHSGSTSSTSISHTHSYSKGATVETASSSTSSDLRLGVQGGVKYVASAGSGTTGSAGGSHNHTVTISSAATGITAKASNSGKSSPDAINIKPYTYTVYAWRRTS